MGLALASTGTHPWANYLDQRIIETEHYSRLRGELRWVEARGRVLVSPGGSSRLIGVAYDSTDARDARVRLARTLETMNDAFFALDRDWRFTYVNRQAERLLLRTREDLLGKGLWDEFPEALGTPFQTHYEGAATSGEPVVFEAEFAPLAAWTGGTFFAPDRGESAVETIRAVIAAEFDAIDMDRRVLELSRTVPDWTVDGLGETLASGRGRIAASLSRLGRRGLLTAAPQ